MKKMLTIAFMLAVVIINNRLNSAEEPSLLSVAKIGHVPQREILNRFSDNELIQFLKTVAAESELKEAVQEILQERRERIKQRNMFIEHIKGSKLNLAEMELQYLIPGVFEDPKFEQIQELYLNNNQLKTIDPQTFAGLNLQVLSLANNQIVAIDLQAFAGLNNLQKLYLANNQLTAINTQPFSNLKWLDLANNKLTDINTQPLANVERLNLDNNQLETIDTQPLVKLKELYLENNQLTEETRIRLNQLSEREVFVAY